MRVSSVELGGTRFGVTTSTDPYVTSFVGPYSDLRGLAACTSCQKDSLFDAPYRADTSGLMLARRVGQVMGAPALFNAKADDNNNLVMTRATNLATLTAAWLLQFQPEARQSQMESVAGLAWTDRVLKFAGKVPGGIGISDAVRFALGMHFMVGILETQTSPGSANAEAYRAFADMFKEAEAELRGESRDSGLNGLGALGLATTTEKKEADKKTAAKKVVKAAKQDQLEKATDWTADLICKGLKALLGDVIGGAICWIITKGLQVITASLNMLIKIHETAIVALWDFLQALAKGDIMGAIKSLLMAVTRILFLLFLPISKPFFGIGSEELNKMAEKVAKKNPFFAISVILGIVGVASPSPSSISTLILALSPAIAVFVAPGIAKLLKASVDKMERGIEQFIKIALVVYQGAMALADILPRLRQQLETYLTKKGGAGGVVSSLAGSAMKKLQDSWGKLTASFAKMNFNDAATVMSAIFSIIPDVLGALGEEIGQEIPAVDETIRAIKDAPGKVDKQEALLAKNSQKFFEALSPEKQKAIVVAQAKKMGYEVSKPMPSTVKAAQNAQRYLAQTQAPAAQTQAPVAQPAQPAPDDWSKIQVPKKKTSPVMMAGAGVLGAVVIALVMANVGSTTKA